MTKLLSPDELAEMLGIPLSTIYSWKCRGKGPAPIRLGRHLRFRDTDVEAWLDEQATRTRAAKVS